MTVTLERLSTHGARPRVDLAPPAMSLVVVIAVALVVPPLVWLLVTSLSTPDGAGLANYAELLRTPRFREAALNSLELGIGAGVVGVLMGVPLAWLVSRTDLPLAAVVRLAMTGALIVPPFLSALAWILLAGPNAGLLNLLARQLFGLERGPFNVFSIGGLIFVVGLNSASLVFLLVSSALEQMPSDLEDASRIFGAGTAGTARRVTLPLVLPTIAAAFSLSFAEAITLFGTPAMIGLPARLPLLTTQLWALFQSPPRVDLAAALAVPFLAAVALLLALQRALLGRRGFATLTGKPHPHVRTRLGVWRLPLACGALLVVLCSVVLPVGVVVLASLSRSWNRGLGLDNLTLQNYTFVLFGYGATQSAVSNSLLLGLLTASIATVLGAGLAYMVGRRLARGVRWVAGLASTPLALPSVVLGIGLFALYTRPPLVLYGTIWILFVAYLTKLFPVAYASASASLRSLGPELEEAARIGGADRLGAFREVALPLMRPALTTAWVLIFIAALRELSASVLLFTSNSRVIPVAIYDLYESGRFEQTSVLAVLLLVLTFGVLGLVRRLGSLGTGVRVQG
jgi:iron(III) transport system permease protein